MIDGRGDEPVFTDGPFLEAKEWAAGLWIIDAPDLDVALKLMGGGSKACNRRLEVWPLLQEPEQTLRMPGPRPPRRVGAGRGDNRQAVRQS